MVSSRQKNTKTSAKNFNWWRKVINSVEEQTQNIENWCNVIWTTRVTKLLNGHKGHHFALFKKVSIEFDGYYFFLLWQILAFWKNTSSLQIIFPIEIFENPRKTGSPLFPENSVNDISIRKKWDHSLERLNAEFQLVDFRCFYLKCIWATAGIEYEKIWFIGQELGKWQEMSCT